MIRVSTYCDHEIQELTTLVPGDSGAWVIRDGRLCGHIIAGRQGLKWAYMITIEEVFTEIKERFNAKEVCLPLASMANSYRVDNATGFENGHSHQAKVGPSGPSLAAQAPARDQPALGCERENQDSKVSKGKAAPFHFDN